MSEIAYKYCVDKENNLICIDEVTEDTRDSYKDNLFCLQCGKEMTAKLGKIKAHHFAHKVDCACDGESYLHKLAKQLFKQTFDSAPCFPLRYNTEIECDKTSCPYRKEECKRSKQKSVNLKELYQHCELEEGIKDKNGNSYIADILLTSDNPGIKPLMIEIFVMHECTDQKKYSGLEIVELKINSENDIIQLHKKCAIEEGGSVRLFNFERNLKEPLSASIKRYVYNSKGVTSLIDISCKEADKIYDKDSLLELNLKNNYSFGNDKEFDSYIKDRCGFDIKSCKTCLHLQENKTYKNLEESMPPYCYEVKEICEDYKKVENSKFKGGVPSETEFVVIKGEIPEAYKVLVYGPYTYHNIGYIKDKVQYFLQNKCKQTYVIIMFAWASNSNFAESIIKMSLDLEIPYRAENIDWIKYGKKAPYFCVSELIKGISAAIVFDNGKDGPTQYLLEQLKEKKIPCRKVSAF